MKLFNILIVALLSIRSQGLPQNEDHSSSLDAFPNLSLPFQSDISHQAQGPLDVVSTDELKGHYDLLRARGETRNPKKQSPAFKALKKRVRVAHGAIMGLVFLGIYPFTSLMMRFFNFPHMTIVHAGIQIFAMVMMYAGMSLGIWFARYDDKYFNTAHTRMGVVIPGLMALQPLFGYLHHRGYIRTGGRTFMTYVHANYGRILMLLGGINTIISRVNEGSDYAHGQTIMSTLFAIVTGLYLIGWAVSSYIRRRGQKESQSETVSVTIEDKGAQFH